MKKIIIAVAVTVVVLLAGEPEPRAELPVPAKAWVSSGSATHVYNGPDLDITQNTKKAILNWESFDIGAGNAVNFHQPSSDAVALNRIFQNNPSRIMGALNANGQLYLINSNGILFGAGARVNVHSLIASTLDVEDQIFETVGITNAINQDIASAAFAGSEPMGSIEIEPGAVLKSGEGGRILVFAPEVINAGRIETPGGQAVLAGSHDRVFLAASDDENLRGLLVEVDTGGKVENLGTIIAERGNVSLVGLAINQDGVVSATTAVNFNGSIRLAARHKATESTLIDGATGRIPNPLALSTTPDADAPLQEYGIRFGAGSITEVVPDSASPELAIDEQPQAPSRIEADAKTVHIETGAVLRATGGEINIEARRGKNDSGAAASVQLDPGSVLDVSGTDTVVLPMSRNQGRIELRGNELADFPVQRDGVLRGQTVEFDLRRHPMIGNLDAVYSGIERSVAERLAEGGSIRIEAERMNAAAGSLLDFSGGLVTYEPGELLTTLLVSEGRVFDFSSADPLLGYDKIIFSSGKQPVLWGQYQPGYVEGRDAGSLAIIASDIILDGDLSGHSTSGVYQRSLPANLQAGVVRPYDQTPSGGGLTLGEFTVEGGVARVIGPRAIVFQTDRTGSVPEAGTVVLDPDLFEHSGVDNLLFNSGNIIRVEPGVEIDFDPGADIHMRALGDIDFQGDFSLAGGTLRFETVGTLAQRPAIRLASGSRIDTQGRWINDSELLKGKHTYDPLYIDGGSVTLAANGDLSLASGSRIDVGGGALLSSGGQLISGDAGSITLSSRPASSLGSETALVLDGMLRGFGLQHGGSLSLTGPGFTIGDAVQEAPPGFLQLEPDFFTRNGFSEFSLTAESTLDNQLNTLIEVTGGTALNLVSSNIELLTGFRTAPTGTDIDLLSRSVQLPRLQRRATALDLRARRRILPAPNLTLPAGIIVGEGAAVVTDIGGEIRLRSDDRMLVSGELNAPAGSIELQLDDVGDLAGFRAQGIWLDDTAVLSARGAARVLVNNQGLRTGEVIPGGNVSLHALRGYIVTAPGSSIDVSGTASILDLPGTGMAGLATPRSTYIASAGGAVSLIASEGILAYGNLAARGGGHYAADGSLTVALDLTDRAGNAPFFGQTEEQFPETRRVVAVGSPRPFDADWLDFGSSAFRSAFYSGAFDTLGQIDPGAGVNGLASLNPDLVRQGGFDTLVLRARQSNKQRADQRSLFSELEAEVRLTGDLDLALHARIILDAPIISSDGGSAVLRAPYVALGSTNSLFGVSRDPVTNLFVPQAGAGQLAVDATMIDVKGFTSLRGFGPGPLDSSGTDAPVTLTAREDIRLQGIPVPEFNQTRFASIAGELTAASDMTLVASQIYPTSLSEFTLSLAGSADSDTLLRIGGNGNSATAPLSAGGQLVVSAPVIEQDGTLRAPFGRILLGELQRDAAGRVLRDSVSNEPLLGEANTVMLSANSVTSVAGDDLTVPLGELLLENNWVFEINGITRGLDEPRLFTSRDDPRQTALAPPDRPWIKGIEIAGDAIDFQTGAVVDVSGGGDLLAAEFRPGPLGSQDILAAGDSFAFAIVPTLGSEYAPVDPLLSFGDFAASDLAPDLPVQPIADTHLIVTIGAGSSLPAGDYAVLPRGYAVLPGAYLLTPLPGTQDFIAGSGVTGPGGAPVVAARFAVPNSAVHQGRWIGVAVEDRSRVFNRAEYLVASANGLFDSRARERGTLAPQLPRDAGKLVLAAGQSLGLGGTLTAVTREGRGSQVDITAADLAVVDSLSGTSRRVELLAADLNQLGAGSLLIGGRRSFAETQTSIEVSAGEVLIDSGVELDFPEILLVAQDRLTVASGASLRGEGTAETVGVLGFAPDANGVPGARTFVRVSGNDQVSLDTGHSDAATGNLELQAGATLFGAGSVTLDATNEVLIQSDILTANGSIRLNAAQIGIGGVPADTPGLALRDLGTLQAAELALSSQGTIDFYGNVDGQFGSLILDSAGLVGRTDIAGAPASVKLAADDLTLLNSQSAMEFSAGSSGTLHLDAGNLFLEGGGYVIGFQDVNWSAGRIESREATDVDVAGDLRIAADLFTVQGGGMLELDADGEIAISPLTADPAVYREIRAGILGKQLVDSLTPGGRLAITGSAIRHAGNIVTPSGAVELHATGGAGDVMLEAGAIIDVAGRIETFGDLSFGSSGGRIGLRADSGAVTLEAGSHLDTGGAAVFDVTGIPLGGDAGLLEIITPTQTFSLDQTPLLNAGIWLPAGEAAEMIMVNPAELDILDEQALEAGAGALQTAGLSLDAGRLANLATAFDGGRFHLDTRGLDSGYALLNQALRSAGIGGAQEVRVRSGDLDVTGLIRATQLALTADRGSIRVAGVVDAGSQQAGRVVLNAGLDIELQDGSVIDASASGDDETGGEVVLRSRSGYITAGRSTDKNRPLVNVSGTGDVSETGKVQIVAARSDDNLDVQLNPIFAQVTGADRIEVIGNRIYEGITRIDSNLVGNAGDLPGVSIRGDVEQFMAQADAVALALDPTESLARGSVGDAAPASILHIMPGVEIHSPPGGDLSLDASWDLSTWRDGTEPGLLSLRADGSLYLGGDLSDGIGLRQSMDAKHGLFFTPISEVEALLPDASWSYQLVAGADLRSDTEVTGLAPVASADPLATRTDQSFNLTIADGVRVRTGSGDIEVATSGDLDYGGRNAAIYTTGKDAGYGTISLEEAELELVKLFSPVPSELNASEPFFFDTYLPGIGFGEAGGDVRIRVDGDVHGPGSDQLFTDWLVVLGGQSVDLAGAIPPLWGIRYDRFRQNLGALGGGDVALEVAGDVNDLSVVLPTTGQPAGQGYEFKPVSLNFASSGSNEVKVLGGGDLDMQVRGDIRGGNYLIGRGTGRIQAEGQVSESQGLAAIVSLGAATLEMTAGEGLALETAFNFSMLGRERLDNPFTAQPLAADTRSFYFTYGQGSALALTALNGDVQLRNKTRNSDPLFADLLQRLTLPGEDTVLSVYPGSLSARALYGDILVERNFQLFPDPHGNLELLAGGNIADLGYHQSTSPVTIVQSDADPLSLPSTSEPLTVAPDIDVAFLPRKQRPIRDEQRLWHAAIPVHLVDETPSRIVARQGSIGQVLDVSRGIRLFTAEETLVYAGADIRNLDIEIQNNKYADASLIQAGGKIVFEPSRDQNGRFTQSGDQGILVTGPGSLAVIADGDIDLGTTDGIVSAGNLRNLALAERGAELTVMAGTGTQSPAYAALFENLVLEQAPVDLPVTAAFEVMLADGSPFTAADAAVLVRRVNAIDGVAVAPDSTRITDGRLSLQLEITSADAVDSVFFLPGMYFNPADIIKTGFYRAAVRSFMERREAHPLSGTEALALFSDLPERKRRDLLLDVFFNELRLSGSEATTTGSNDYERGYAAITTLFPAAGMGDLSLLLSRIHTQAGGDIRILVPGGGANAGAASLEGLSKTEDQLGVVVQRHGDVSAFVQDDFLVNASRVFALQGGDILMWSSLGDIDAGRGAKTALSAPPPQQIFDPATESFKTVFPPQISGSGIRNFAPPGTTPGSVFLFAPSGTISAGDAGIGSAGNVTIGAAEVLGADNIDIGGIGVGVPVATTGSVSGLGSVSNAATAATRTAEETAMDSENSDSPDSGRAAQLGILTVEVLGMGECEPGEENCR